MGDSPIDLIAGRWSARRRRIGATWSWPRPLPAGCPGAVPLSRGRGEEHAKLLTDEIEKETFREM